MTGARTLADVMSDEVVQIGYEATVAESARTMQAAGVGSVVVIRARNLVGIFTERDLVTAAAAGVDASRSLVRAWMTDNPLTLPSSTPLAEALDILRQRRHRRLPVVDDGELVGMVSLSDFIRSGEIAIEGSELVTTADPAPEPGEAPRSSSISGEAGVPDEV